MVGSDPRRLDDVFGALADPTRRALIARLAGQDGLSISELAHPFSMSLPAVMKHIAVLERAGLVARHKTGRSVSCRLVGTPMQDAMSWLAPYRQFWSESLDRLAQDQEAPP